MGDYTYRSREKVEEWKTRCPILRLRQRLLDRKLADTADLDAIDREIAASAEEAHQFAESSPWPDAKTAIDHVFSER
jgi:TPP-dependent pyruvate/acetoin dehydrogenase alpha subunit